MKFIKDNALLAVVFVLSVAVTAFVSSRFLRPSEPTSTPKQEIVQDVVQENVPQENVLQASSEPVSDEDSVSNPLYVHDSAALIRSFEPWMVFSENFNASYRDSSFEGHYQLTYPVGGPYDTLGDTKFDRLLLSLLFEKAAPKKVNRKSIQAALDGMMKQDLKTTRRWWNEAKIEFGENWRDEVMFCTGFFYAMPTARAREWISFQQVDDFRCGGNGGPNERYYTIIKVDDPYVMDTTAFVPDFREKLYDMITDNVIYNFYHGVLDRGITREEVHKATAEEFGGNFQPSLTLSGVKFMFSTWGLPGTCHADGRVSVIVPYRMIQEIFTEKFKNDIGLGYR